MATSGKVSSKMHEEHGAYWSFEWTAKSNVATDETTVSYNIYRRGRTSTPTWLATQCTITIWYNNITEEVLNTPNRSPGPTNDYGTSFANVKEKEGSFTVKHDEDGKGSFSIEIGGMILNQKIGISKTDVTLNTIASTSCSAPTSIEVSKTIVTLEDSINISWSGAKGGTNNPISGYYLYYRISEDGKYPTSSDYEKRIHTKASVRTHELALKLSENDRGKTIAFGVQALGNGDKGDSFIKEGGKVKINRLPGAPTLISQSTKKIPSTGGKVTFNISPGKDLDGQTCSIKYKIGASGDIKSCSSSLTLSLYEASNIYFYSHDGLERSSDSITAIVTQNTKPEIEVKYEFYDLYNNKWESEKSSLYAVKARMTVTPKSERKIETYRYVLQYREKDSDTWLTKTLAGKSTESYKQWTDIRKQDCFDLATKEYEYRYVITGNDGLENSDEWKSKIMFLKKYPDLKNIFNILNFKNNDDEPERFSKVIGFGFGDDPGYDRLRITQTGKTEKEATIELEYVNKTLRGQWKNINLNPGKYNFDVELGWSNSGYYTNKISFEVLKGIVKTKDIKVANLQPEQQSFFPYKDGAYPTKDDEKISTDYTFGMFDTFGIGQLPQNYVDILKEYGMKPFSKNGESNKNFFAQIKIGDKTSEKTYLKEENILKLTNPPPATLYFTLSTQNLRDMLSGMDLNRNESYESSLIIGFVDVFNNIFTTSTNYKINYKIKSKAEDIQIGIGIKEDNGINFSPITDWPCLKETMPLYISGTVKTYNSNPKIQVLINRIKDGVSSGYTNFGEEIPIEKIPPLGKSAEPPAPGNKPLSFEFLEPIMEIGEITELGYTVSFKIKVITDADDENYYYNSDPLYNDTIVRGHSSQASFTLDEVDYSGGELTYEYTNTHLGAIESDNALNSYSFSAEAKLQYRNISSSGYSEENEIGINLKEDSCPFIFPEEVDALVCRFAIETTQSVSHKTDSNIKFETTKTFHTNEKTIYTALPTVSYRKNFLGINASNLADKNLQGAVLVIGEHESKKIIYFVAASGLKSIDTSTGELNGFVIDGGSW